MAATSSGLLISATNAFASPPALVSWLCGFPGAVGGQIRDHDAGTFARE
jgi:hypothetical protein